MKTKCLAYKEKVWLLSQGVPLVYERGGLRSYKVQYKVHACMHTVTIHPSISAQLSSTCLGSIWHVHGLESEFMSALVQFDFGYGCRSLSYIYLWRIFT